jgi:hypothetical protein
MDQTAHDYIAFLMGKGISKPAAVGVVSVLKVESDLNPLSENNTGSENPGAINPKGSFGLKQANGVRQQNLLNFAKKKGLNYKDAETQLWEVLNEMANDYHKTWAVVNNPASTYAEVIDVMVRDFEHPKEPDPEVAAAMKHAEEYIGYNIDVPATPVPAPVPVPVSPASTQVSSNVVLDRATLVFVVKLLSTLSSLEV